MGIGQRGGGRPVAIRENKVVPEGSCRWMGRKLQLPRDPGLRAGLGAVRRGGTKKL